MRNRVVVTVVFVLLTATTVRAAISVAGMSPDQVHTALAAIDAAKKIAEAGRATLLLAGPVLSTAESANSDDLAVIDYPNIAKMRPGSILLLAKRNCEPVEDCLLARRVVGFEASGSLQTEPYGSAESILLGDVQATLLGSVVYAVDLRTGDIRDLRPDRRAEHLSVAEAVAQEATR
jgi:hypothetical protein